MMTRHRIAGLLGLTLAVGLLTIGCAPAAPPPSPTAAAPKPTTAPAVAKSEAPAAQPTAVPATKSEAPASASGPSWNQAEWDQTVEAARKEGSIVLAHTSGDNEKRVTDVFEAKFPGIKVERLGLGASVFSARAVSEQRQGLFSTDLLFMTGLNSAERVLMPAGAVGDIRPILDSLPPDVRDDTKWANGFNWQRSTTSPDSLVTQINIGYRIYVNRDVLPESELATSSQLADPKFKGKITMYRPQQSSAGSNALAALVQSQGEDFVRKVMFDQEPVAVDNIRQSIEWMVQGRYPICIGVTPDTLAEFTSVGLGLNAQPMKEVGTTTVSAAGVTLMKNNPHPNATKVFLAWFLSKEGQDSWNELGGPDATSRRLDARVAHPESTPDWSKINDYKVIIGTPTGDVFLDKALAIANEKH
jgi:iron(III) transport system substrate-binding protein